MADRGKINDALNRYAWGYDENDMGAIEGSFAKDASMSMRIADGDLIGPFEGRAAIMDLMKGSLEAQDDQRRHITTNVFVDEETDDSATVTSYLTLVVIKDGALNVISSGWYRDEFVVEEGSWVIHDRFLQLDLPY